MGKYIFLSVGAFIALQGFTFANSTDFENCLVACQTTTKVNLKIDPERAYQINPEESAHGVWRFNLPEATASISVETPFTYSEDINNAFFLLEASPDNIDYTSVYFWQWGDVGKNEVRDLNNHRFVKISLFGTELKDVSFFATTVPEPGSFLLLLLGTTSSVFARRPKCSALNAS